MHLADTTGSPPEWRGGAACLNHDPDLFFPEGTQGGGDLGGSFRGGHSSSTGAA
jgi:hypothetical protein